MKFTWVLDNVFIFSVFLFLFGNALAFIILRYSSQESQKPKFWTYLAQVVMNILIGLSVSYLFSSASERGHRLWTLRQEHLVRLRPVLHMDSEKLSEIARRIHIEGRVIDYEEASKETELNALFSPDVLTEDLANHYIDYWQEKRRLRSDVEEQDAEFRETVAIVTKTLTLPRIAENQRLNVARSFLEKCLGKGPGFTITMDSSGYTYYMLGGSGGNHGSPPPQPSEDLLDGFRAFKAFRPDPDVTAHCETLNRRATKIYENASKLSAQALLLAEQTTLSGECKYTKLE